MSERRDLASDGRARARPVTLADIAIEARTSASTASRALGGRGYVSAGARERVLGAAERLGYVPNAWARTLKQRTSRLVGVVVSDIASPFDATLAAGIEEALREAGYQIALLSHNGDSPQELGGARTFAAMRAAGVIVTPVSGELAARLARHGIAVVEVDRRLAHVPCDAVVVDNERGAREATAHLLSAGHRRVALLVARTNWTTGAGRLRGYRSAHADAGVSVDDRLIVAVSSPAPALERPIAALLDELGATAIFAASDVLAERAWHVLRRRGVRVPAEVAFVAFDDIPWMAMVEPRVTAVAQPAMEMGRRAARLLLRRVEDRASPTRTECLQPTLVVRESSRRGAGSPHTVGAPA